MPKLKTHKGAAKRVKVTGTGKFVRERQFSGCSHILTKKSAKRIRKFRKQVVADATDTPRPRPQLQGGQRGAAAFAHLRVSRSTAAQARFSGAVDHPHQRSGAPGGP